MKRVKPIIGIVGAIRDFDSDEVYIAANDNYRESIVLCGGIPIIILPTQQIRYDTEKKPSETERLTEEEKQDLETQIDMCDGILFIGGKRWYEYQEYIFNISLKKNKSILGICLGMQMMVGAIARKYGDGTYKNIKNETSIDHNSIAGNKYAHSINIVDNTILKSILKVDSCKVNSRHNYHVGDVNEYIISSYSEDGIPESIEMPDKRFVIGLQWHPEEMIHFDENSKKIFSEFVNSCK